MSLWKSYADAIKRNCASPADVAKDLSYWRNNLFANIIIYLLPFCLIALVPSLYFIIMVIKQLSIATLDAVTVLVMVLVAFLPRIPIPVRKVIFIGCFYMFGCLLLYFVGVSGSGFVYLQTSSIFFILIFPSRYAWWTVVISFSICLCFGLAIPAGILPWPHNRQNSLGAWIAVSSSLIFLNLLQSALIPRLFTGLQQTIEKEQLLQGQLSLQQDSLEQTLGSLKQKNEELEQFAYVASHDLQEPLRMISSFLAKLDNKYTALIDEKGKQYIHFAVDGAHRMRQIILDLLDFYRAGQTADTLEAVDINELIEEIRVLCRRQIEESKAVILTENLPVISSYKSPVRQVFQNLISNALKYSKEDKPPQIRIVAKLESGYWQFEVSDNGIGISSRFFEKIFAIFQRLHGRGEYSGTGMGLAICKKIIDSFGGRIWVESEPGKGSHFYFTLPFSRPEHLA